MRKNALSSVCSCDVFLSFFLLRSSRFVVFASDAMLFSSLLEREKLFSPKNKGALCSLSLSLSKGERL